MSEAIHQFEPPQIHSREGGKLELPDSWVFTLLGNIVDYGKATKATAADVDEGTWVLELEDIEKNTSKLLRKVTFKDRMFKSTKNRFGKGDVLYGKLRPYLNKIIVAEDDGVATTEIIPLNGGVFLDNGYIFYWLKSAEFLSYVTKVGYGVNMPRLGTNDAKVAPFVLAPLAEQKQIATQLDQLLAQVDTLKNRLDAIPNILKRFRQSVLAAAVSGKLTEEWRGENECSDTSVFIAQLELERNELKSKKKLKKSFGPSKAVSPLFTGIDARWQWVGFEHIAAHDNNALKAGPFGSALKKSDCIESGYKVYGQEQVIAGNEGLDTYFISATKFEQLSSCEVGAGDILISLVGTIGKVLILSEDAEKGIINPRLVKLGLQGFVNREFIRFYLESPIAKGFFKGFSHGGTMDILNLGILKELPIPFPPIEEQTEIVRRVEQLFTFADQIEQRVKDAQSRVNHLTQSILAKAFHGELTAQWREDNPELISGENSAEALLARIKEEREKLAIANKRTNKTKKKQ